MQTGEDLRRAYEAHTPGSRVRFERARERFPGGDTRASAHYGPYPLSIEEGAGCRLIDADGHEYLDFMNNFTSLIHGHGHPAVVAAVREQVAKGTAYAAPSRSQTELAGLLCDRIASVERLRFTSSGSEATLMAIRAARAVTGRDRVVKFEGGYHGSYDLAEVSLVPLPGQRGQLRAPTAIALDRSISHNAVKDVVVAPFNEPELAAERIAKHASELAAVIVEPLQASMGMLPADPEFVRALREVTRGTDVLLIFDEVVTLRLATGGAQQLYGVTPDLTAMGKYIGGGLPIGAFGGRADLMDVFDPSGDEAIFHASTFSGNALTMAAGAAAVSALEPADFERLNALGDRLRDGMNRVFEASGVPGQVTGTGSLAHWILTRAPLHGPREIIDAMIRAGQISNLLHLGLLRRGVFGAARGMLCVSTPMQEAEIDRATNALRDALDELKPVIERERPALLEDASH